jgi:hypothetical protein
MTTLKVSIYKDEFSSFYTYSSSGGTGGVLALDHPFLQLTDISKSNMTSSTLQ